MKKVVIAIDSFKGSLSTFEAGRATEDAAKEIYKDVNTVMVVKVWLKPLFLPRVEKL